MRDYLGGHDSLPPGYLHKEEVFSLIIRAGRAAGFVVRTEVPARWAGNMPTGRPPTLDCGWYTHGGALLVAWEFDGRDVGDGHLTGPTGNRRKFSGCAAPMKFQVLYSAKNDLLPKPPSRAAAVRLLLLPDVEVLTDEELMVPGGIEGVMTRARTAGKFLP